MKNSVIARRAAAICLAGAVSLSAYGSGDLSARAAQPGLTPTMSVTRTAAAQPLVLPTNAQVIAAVAAAVNVKKLPPQRPTSTLSGFHCLVYPPATSAPPSCIYGDPEGSHSLVLYGDSHAANWIASFDALGKYLHWKIYQVTMSQCQVPDFPAWQPQANRPYPECSTFRTNTLNFIKQLHPDMVVMASEGDGPQVVVNGSPTRRGLAAVWAAGLARVIDTIKPNTGKAVVLGDFAYGSPAGKDCLPAHADDIQVCNLRRATAVDEAHNQMEQRTAQQHGALYVPTVQWFCTVTVCPAVVGGISTRDDGFHVSPSYALWLSDALGTATGMLPASAPAS